MTVKSHLVYGPQGCGKTTNARAIADALGLEHILDDWGPGMPAPSTNTLVLTSSDGPYQPFERRLLSFNEAMQRVGEARKSTASTATAQILTCVYCGHEYPQHTPAAGHQVLTDHIRTCAKHPLREAELAVARLHSALAGLVGESTPQGLAQLEAGLQLVPMPATEKALMITAIRALRDTSGLLASTEVQP